MRKMVLVKSLQSDVAGGCGMTAPQMSESLDFWDLCTGIPSCLMPELKRSRLGKDAHASSLSSMSSFSHMATADGRVISTGSNVMTWDSDRKVVVSASSGFDLGKPYNGTSVLVGMSGTSLEWEYTEHSQGKTTVYENTIEYRASPDSGSNSRVNSVQVKGDGGEPWISKANRENPCKEMLVDAGLTGTWESTHPDGSMSREVISWVADEHVLKYEHSGKSPGGEWRSDALFVWYWDPSYDHIATLYLDAHGTVIHGKVESIVRDGDAVTIVASHEGSRFGGLTMSTQVTQVVTEKMISTTFKDMSLDGVRHSMSWSEGVQTIKRVD